MAAHDESWDAFRAELKRWMEFRRVTNKELAAALNEDLAEAGLSAPVDEKIVKRWRHSTAPPLKSLKVIARILHMSDSMSLDAAHDPTHLPRIMGILDPAPASGELIEAAYRLHSLRTQIADAQATLAAATTDEAVMNIVRAAAHADLGCAVLPIHEGPPGYPMHICDRLDIRKAVPRSHLNLEEHHQLRDALQDAFAVPNNNTPRFCDTQSERLSHWSVPYIGRPRTRALHTTHRRLPALAITSVTALGRIDEIGDIVAMVLGYGFTTTRQLARELVSGSSEYSQLRGNIHNTFLSEATPQRRVWTHDLQVVPSGDTKAPFRDHEGRVTTDLVQFFIAKDDAMLRDCVPAEQSADEAIATFESLQNTRDALRARAEQASEHQRVFVVPARHQTSDADRWQQNFECVLSILHTLAELGIHADVDDVHAQLMHSEPSVAPQVLRWLADHDAPYVSRRYRTMPS